MKSWFVVGLSGVALGALGAVPMFVYGLYLGTQRWAWFKTPEARAARRENQINFFGRERQVVQTCIDFGELL